VLLYNPLHCRYCSIALEKCGELSIKLTTIHSAEQVTILHASLKDDDVQRKLKSLFCAPNTSRGSFAQSSTAVKILCFASITRQCISADCETNTQSGI